MQIMDLVEKQENNIPQTCDKKNKLNSTKNYLENCKYQSTMLLTLINDLMDLAKIESVNFSLN